MRVLACLILAALLSACAGYHTTPDVGEQAAELPSQGNDARRDGFYDGGVFDPDARPGPLAPAR